jgi:hypothetical protein
MPGDVVCSEGTMGREIVFVVGGTLDVSAFICPAMAYGEVSFLEAQVNVKIVDDMLPVIHLVAVT